MDKVKLTREDWEEGERAAESMLKNAMCQTIVYQGQLDTCRRELAKFPEKVEVVEEKKENSMTN